MLDTSNLKIFTSGESKEKDFDPSKIKFAKVIPICTIKSLVDPEFRKAVESSIKYCKQIIDNAQKEFKFAGFSINDKCKANFLKEIKNFDKTNKDYTPIDIIQLNTYHKTRLNFQINFGVFSKSDLEEIFTVLYTASFHDMVEAYNNIDMIITLIDERYIIVTIFSYKVKVLNKTFDGQILQNYVLASTNPLDSKSPVILHSINYNKDWFGGPK